MPYHVNLLTTGILMGHGRLNIYVVVIIGNAYLHTSLILEHIIIIFRMGGFYLVKVLIFVL